MNSFPSSSCPASPPPQHYTHKPLTEFKQQDMPLSNLDIKEIPVKDPKISSTVFPQDEHLGDLS